MDDKVASHLSRAKDSLCLLPFVHVNFGQGGRIALCCRSDFESSTDNLAKIPAESLWNHEIFKDARRKMLKGERPPACATCYNFESANSISPRQRTLDPKSPEYDWFNNSKFDEATGEIQTGVKSVKVYLSNLCNLACRMCNSEHSTRWEGMWRKSPRLREFFERLGPVNEAYSRVGPIAPGFEKEIKKFIVANLDSIEEINFVGGEPLLHPEHYEVLELLKGREHKIKLLYDTNMTTLGTGGKSPFPHWGKYRKIYMTISVDGMPGLFEYVRPGLNVARFEKNLKEVQAFQQSVGGLDKILLFGSCTLSAYNMRFLPEILQYIVSLGLEVFSSQVEFPHFLSCQVLPPHEKLKIRKSIEAFLANLEENMRASLDKHPAWAEPDHRERALQSTKFHLRDALNYMDAKDESEHFKDFLEFDRILNEEFHGGSIRSIHPHWDERSWYQRIRSKLSLEAR